MKAKTSVYKVRSFFIERLIIANSETEARKIFKSMFGISPIAVKFYKEKRK